MSEIYEVGKFYTVPTVEGTLHRKRDIWVILGPKHTDEGVVNFPHTHYHLDYRFFNNRKMERFGFSMFRSPIMVDVADRPESERYLDVGEIVYRRRLCHREMPAFPSGAANKAWLPALAKEHEGKVLGENLICPHRGVDLSTFRPDKDNCIVCPLHGLRWDLTTMRLATRQVP